MAGRGDAVRAPALTSAESIAAAAPGRWIYRVAAETILVHESPSPAAAVVGRRARGDFLRGIELRDTTHSGPWLRLDGEGSVEAAAAAGGRRGGGGYGDDDEDYDDDEEDEDGDGYGGGGGAYGGAAPWRFYNAELRRKPGAPHLWVRLQGTAEDDGPLVVRVDASDAPHVHEASVVEGEVRDDAGAGAAAAGAAAPPPQRRLDSLAAEFLDAPFIPQVLSGERAGVGCPPASHPDAYPLHVAIAAGQRRCGRVDGPRAAPGPRPGCRRGIPARRGAGLERRRRRGQWRLSRCPPPGGCSGRAGTRGGIVCSLQRRLRRRHLPALGGAPGREWLSAPAPTAIPAPLDLPPPHPTPTPTPPHPAASRRCASTRHSVASASTCARPTWRPRPSL